MHNKQNVLAREESEELAAFLSVSFYKYNQMSVFETYLAKTNVV